MLRDESTLIAQPACHSEERSDEESRFVSVAQPSSRDSSHSEVAQDLSLHSVHGRLSSKAKE